MIVIKISRRVVAIVLAVVFCLTLAGCNKKPKEEEPTGTTAPITVKVTFPEGYTIKQIGEKLGENKVCSAADFYTACNQIPAGYEDLLKNVSAENKVFLLEGYVFPDTYEFFIGENAQNALSRFLKNTKTKMASISDFEARATAIGMTPEEVITLASVIQSECGVKSEMAIVSSVFHNRLQKQNSGFPYIGSDVTRLYIEVKMKDYIDANGLDYKNLFEKFCTNDGYDLKTRGLPSGPICNPGRDAIIAALEPANTDFLYFFTDKEGNFHYNTTLSAHQSQYRNLYK